MTSGKQARSKKRLTGAGAVAVLDAGCSPLLALPRWGIAIFLGSLMSIPWMKMDVGCVAGLGSREHDGLVQGLSVR